MISNVKKNFLYQSVYQILMVITPLITSPYISRILGAENIGVYNYYYSIAYYYGIFSALGISNYGNRSIATIRTEGKNERSNKFWEIFFMQAIASLIVVLFFIIHLISTRDKERMNLSIEGLYILSVCLDISWFFFGIENFKITVARSFIIKLITVVSIFIFIKTSEDLYKYTFIMAAGALISSLVLWRYLIKVVDKPKIKITSILPHFKPNLLLFIPVISLAIFHYMDKIMLGMMSSMEELGYYSNADKVINIPMGLIISLGTVMLPRMSKLRAENEIGKVNQYLNNSIIFSVWMSCALCFGIAAVAEDFIPLFFGEGFEKCTVLLQLLSPVVIIKSWSNVFKTQFLIPAHKDKEFTISVLMAAVINIILNFQLIPILGAVGAVIGTLVAELTVAIFYSCYASKQINILKSLAKSVPIIFIGLIMYFTIHFIKKWMFIENYLFRIIIEIIVGAIVFMGLSFVVMNLIKFQPMEQFKVSFFKNKKRRIFKNEEK